AFIAVAKYMFRLTTSDGRHGVRAIALAAACARP
ncbi:hypothetical protein D3OALGA1CA_524, partial [Olavius algarvensis associated proteobacterium Delta 3]